MFFRHQKNHVSSGKHIRKKARLFGQIGQIDRRPGILPVDNHLEILPRLFPIGHGSDHRFGIRRGMRIKSARIGFGGDRASGPQIQTDIGKSGRSANTVYFSIGAQTVDGRLQHLVTLRRGDRL